MLEPKIAKKKVRLTKVCNHCQIPRSGDDFIEANSWFYFDGRAPICNSCIKARLIENDWSWAEVDRLCQMLNIPFIPAQFEKLHDINGDDVFPIYARVVQDAEYEGFNWDDYYKEFKVLKEHNRIERELPEIHEKKIRDLQDTWGNNYGEEQLNYLEALFNGMLATQNINGALQNDQAKKVCKLNLAIDEMIRSDQAKEIKALIEATERIIKSADFTPKNVKNASDFSSFGEVAAWKERRGWVNKFYDNVSRDVVDETLNTLTSFNSRLYTNESGLGEDITARIEALKIAEYTEDNYGLELETDLEEYAQEGYEAVLMDEAELDLEDEDERSVDARRI